jgi:hypothetical protein
MSTLRRPRICARYATRSSELAKICAGAVRGSVICIPTPIRGQNNKFNLEPHVRWRSEAESHTATRHGRIPGTHGADVRDGPLGLSRS